MDVQVKITAILPVSSYTSKKDGGTVNSYGFVGETLDDKYPKKIKFDVFGDDRWGSFGLRVGSVYTVSYDLTSKEFNGKWYTHVNAWRASEYTGQGQAVQPSVPQQQYMGYPQAQPMYQPAPVYGQPVVSNNPPF